MTASFRAVELSNEVQNLIGEAGKNLKILGPLPPGAKGCEFIWNNSHQRLWAHVKAELIDLINNWAVDPSQKLLAHRSIVRLERNDVLRTPPDQISIVVPIDGIDAKVDIGAVDGTWIREQDLCPIQLQPGVAIRASTIEITCALFRISREKGPMLSNTNVD